MKLADTCIWIEAITDSALGKSVKSLLKDTPNILVPTIVQYELRRWLLRVSNQELADKVIAITRACKTIDTTESIALYAAELGVQYKLHALDALIYATALNEKATLVTCDAHFKDLPYVEYIVKK
jgi:predicted nucleic acid-binding protein